MNQGLVSVVIIFKDEEQFLREAIASVLGQTYGRWEILLVDDGSVDDSSDIALEFARREGGRIRYLEHAGHANCGMSTSRNLGIRESRGEFVAFLDGDDVWLPNHLAFCVDILNRFHDADMMYGRTRYWYSWGGNAAKQSDWLSSHWFRADRVVEAPELLARFLTGRASLPCTCSMVVRSRALQEVGGFLDTFRTLYEDQAFLARFCLARPVFVSNRCTSLYRQHTGATCAVAAEQGENELALARYHDWLDSMLEQAGDYGHELRKAARLSRRLAIGAHADWRTRIARIRVRLRQYGFAALERLTHRHSPVGEISQ